MIMSTQHFDDAIGRNPAENYERFFVPAIGEPLARDLVARAALRPGERVLDVACGTGIVARLAARDVGTDGAVAGLDVNPGMLAAARSAESGASIQWHEASADSMPLPDAAFDVVTCQLSFQFMPDKGAALREMHRVLAPGGRLILNVPGPETPVFGALAEALDTHIGPHAAGFVHAVFALHDTAELERLMTDAGFRDVAAHADTRTLALPPPGEFLWQYVTSTPLAPLVGELDPEIRSAVERDVVNAWKEFEKDGALVYRQRVVIAEGRK
jgi:ubiquinone/menaquinone biosynthesis C-methylase UbiE